MLVLAGAAALGGGVMRDVLIGALPPVGISDWRLVTAAAGRRPRDLPYHPGVERISRFVRVLDAAGLAVFAIGGSLKALGAAMDPLAAVLVGGITAVGGGIVRDVLAGQVPEVLRREMYALPALLGSVLIVTAHHFDLINPLTSGAASPSSFACGWWRSSSTSTPPSPCAPETSR